MSARILVVDNYDSFVFNLVQYLYQLGAECEVLRNDEVSTAHAQDGFDGVLLSPGPGTPEEAGVCIEMTRHCAATGVPVFGVCLGMQSMQVAYGGVVDRAPELLHGKTSLVEHEGKGVFAGLPSPFTATRYHSLVVLPETIPAPRPGADSWAISAWTDEDDGNGGTRRVVMGLRRQWADPKKAPLEGVQFHPESFLTEEGPRLLKNFLDMKK